MPKHIPDISHLQFLALAVLLQGELPGRTVRTAIARYGVHRTAAAFYQFMARLERDGMVEGWYEQVEAGDQLVTERRYRITGAGKRAFNSARAFFEDVIGAADKGLSHA